MFQTRALVGPYFYKKCERPFRSLADGTMQHLRHRRTICEPGYIASSKLHISTDIDPGRRELCGLVDFAISHF